MFFIFSMTALAASSQNSLKPEVLGAKAFLEDLLVRRYSQELSVLVKKESFNLGTTLELTEVAKSNPAAATEEPISGLMLGKLDPEELLKKYGAGDSSAQSFLNNYKIKAVAVSVGLNEGLGPEVKAEVEKWLTTRLNGEFGKVGKSTVTFIKIPTSAETKSFWDWLNQFQTLAGQIALGFLAILAVLVWKIVGKPISVNINAPSDLPTLNAQLSGGAKGVSGENNVSSSASSAGIASSGSATPGGLSAAGSIEQVQNKEEILSLTRRLNDLAAKVTNDMEAIVRSWCQMGEPGKLRLACFAEAVGKEIGKLPIPADAIADISRMFAKMTTLDPAVKSEALQKAYWDILAVINLGPESLDQPFGYLGGLNIGLMKELLMDQNPKMQTLVSIYMPNDVRAKYIKTLTPESKMALLNSAAQMNEIRVDELKSMNDSLRSKFQPQGTVDSIPLDMSLKKLVDVLTPIEQLTLLPQVQDPAILEFKRQTATLAFINEWPDEVIKLLVGASEADEIVYFLKVRPEMSERILAQCPPLTAELVRDELATAKIIPEKELNLRIESFAKRLEAMVKLKEISLEEIFANKEVKNTANVAPIKVA